MKSILATVCCFLLSTPLICLGDTVTPPRYDASEYIVPVFKNQNGPLIIELLSVVLLAVICAVVIKKIPAMPTSNECEEQKVLSGSKLGKIQIKRIVCIIGISLLVISIIAICLHTFILSLSSSSSEYSRNKYYYGLYIDGKDYKPCHWGPHKWEVAPDKTHKRCKICHLKYYEESRPSPRRYDYINNRNAIPSSPHLAW